MRTFFLFTVALAGWLLLSGCEKDSPRSLNCEKVRAGLLANDLEAVRKEIDGFTFFQNPDPAASDRYGHRLNIEKLVDALNRECGFTVTMGCYNCTFTNPPQMEIYITLSDGGTTVRKVIDLSYNDSRRLVFAGMHN